MAAIKQAPGGCQCATCLLQWTVTGCNGLALTGCTINVWTNSGKTTFVGTASDNGSGSYSLVTSAGGSYYYEITRARFNLSSETRTLTCGVPRARSLSAATGYTCLVGCAVPVSNTLHFTDSILGTWTLTNGNGTKSYNYPGGDVCQGCNANTLQLGVTFSYLTGQLSIQWSNSSDPTTPFVTQCPVPPGGFGVTYGQTLSIVCPPSFSGTASFNTGPCVTANVNNYVAALYMNQNVNVTWTLTE